MAHDAKILQAAVQPAPAADGEPGIDAFGQLIALDRKAVQENRAFAVADHASKPDHKSLMRRRRFQWQMRSLAADRPHGEVFQVPTEAGKTSCQQNLSGIA